MGEASPLMSVDTLREQLPRVRVIDCSHDLGNPQAGVQQYAQAHIPGAVHAHLDQHLSGLKTGTNGRHPLPQARDLVRWLGEQGIARGDAVVAYDRSGGAYAARLWWLLRWLGHADVRVLDGAWQTWVGAGGPVTAERPQHPAVTYGAPTTDDTLWVDAAFVQHNLDSHTALLVDARGAERFVGAVEPIDPRAGHIPGAINRPYLDNLGPDGCFKPRDVLRAEWRRVLGATGIEQVVAQCGSGVTACHNLLALEAAGIGMGRLYPGSWSEWCSDPRRPLQTGPA
jgi:thiosulfate/3-mercaptopyruvate sulfurtransferase